MGKLPISSPLHTGQHRARGGRAVCRGGGGGGTAKPGQLSGAVTESATPGAGFRLDNKVGLFFQVPVWTLRKVQ